MNIIETHIKELKTDLDLIQMKKNQMKIKFERLFTDSDILNGCETNNKTTNNSICKNIHILINSKDDFNLVISKKLRKIIFFFNKFYG